MASLEVFAGVLGVLALALLGAGYAARRPEKHLLRLAGWAAFGLYWPTQSAYFFAQDDPVNAYFALVAPLLLGYLAFHEWRSYRWGEDPPALRWIAGTAFIAGATYFAVYQIAPVTDFIIGTVAHQSSWLLASLFGTPNYVQVEPGAPVESRYHLYLAGGGTYAVTIVLACTAIQSIMLFVGAIATTQGPARRQKWKAYAVIGAVVWVLNLLRVSGITYGYAVLGILPLQAWAPGSYESFEFMHIWIGKTGSLVALVIIALWLFRSMPDLHRNILDLFDLPKRRRAGFYAGPGVDAAAASLAVVPPPGPP